MITNDLYVTGESNIEHALKGLEICLCDENLKETG